MSHNSKIELTQKITLPTLFALEQWQIANRFFASRLEDLNRTDISGSLLPSISDNSVWLCSNLITETNYPGSPIANINLTDRWFQLVGTSGYDENEVGQAKPDTFASFGGWFAERGLDYIDTLELGISWHDQGLIKAFEFYKMWMIDRIPMKEIEERLEVESFYFEL